MTVPQVVNDTLRGAHAFEALRRLLAGEEADVPQLAEPAFARLAAALRTSRGVGTPSPLDLAMLARQALRYESLQTGISATLWVAHGRGRPDIEDWSRVGVSAVPAGDGYRVQAQPWQPAWLPDVPEAGVDAAAAGEAPRANHDRVRGDPFLRRFSGRTEYQSDGQRAAVRAALTTPAGGTLLVCLPTGDGKSFVFQVAAQLGFGDDDETAGVTLVVTPTVALALDQELAACSLDLPEVPRAYRGGDPAGTNGIIAERIADGTQGLVFASPEAVCGTLLRPLLRAAERGYLRAIVVDEAHLVSSWGANFRPEFQLLSGVRRLLLGAANGPAPRTLLLSATLTGETVATLRVLFADAERPELFRVVAAARLRPEIEYWVAPESREWERQERVLEAVLHTPRPAILYVTERRDANHWYQVLRQAGFRRLARVTGESSHEERTAAVEGWRDGTVDLVVGTSAFGLGIDNARVRTVIHACVPETLDRFYQEVGRGGRDGNAALSLIIPAELDQKTARGLNKLRLLTVDKGLKRWRAMFEHADRIDRGGDVFDVRLDVPPGTDEEYIDMVSEQSTDWNSRTLTLMAGAGLIRLLGRGTGPLPAGADAEDGVAAIQDRGTTNWYESLRIVEPRHLDPAVWAERVEPHRQQLDLAGGGSLRRMRAHLRARECVAGNLAPLYEVAAEDAGGAVIHVARACGGCPACRAAGRPPFSDPAPRPRHPWPSPGAARLRDGLLDQSGRLAVFYRHDAHERMAGADRRRLREALARLLAGGIRNVVIPAGAIVDPLDLQESPLLRRLPLFWVEDVREPLPLGPTLVILPPGRPLPGGLLSSRPAEQARILFLPEDLTDPNSPAARLVERYGGRRMDVATFVLRMSQ